MKYYLNFRLNSSISAFLMKKIFLNNFLFLNNKKSNNSMNNFVKSTDFFTKKYDFCTEYQD